MTHSSGAIGGIAHSEVDHIDPVAPFAVLKFVDATEKVRWQVPHPGSHLKIVSLDGFVLL